MYYMDYTDPAGQRHKHSLKTRDLASAKILLERERKKFGDAAQGLAPARAVDADAFRKVYLARAALTKSTDVLKTDTRRLDDFLRWAGPLDVSRLPRDLLVRWVAHRFKEGRAGAKKRVAITKETALHDARTVLTALRWGKEKGLLETVPDAPDDEGVRSESRKRAIPYLTEKARADLLAACASPIPCNGRNSDGKLREGHTRPRLTPLREIVAVVCYAGLRLEEALYLDWRDVDLERETITVREKAAEDWTTKTRTDRTIPLFPALARELAGLRARAVERFKKDGHGARPLFATRTGKRFARRNILRELETVAERFAIPVERRAPGAVNFLVLRHTFATHLVSRGTPMLAVSQWLGHTSVRTTERHYAEFIPHGEIVARAAAIFDAH